jgi:ribonuclease HI
MTGTALSALQNECGELPLELRRNKQMIQYAIKIKSISDHPAKNVLLDHWTNYTGKFQSGRASFFNKTEGFFDECTASIECVDSVSDPPWELREVVVDTSLSKQFKKQDAPLAIKSIALAAMDHFNSHVAMFTDGSKDLSGKVGSAMYIPELREEISLRLTDNLSVFTSELFAILTCLNWILDDNNVLIGSRDVVIFTDSLSSLVALENERSKSRPNLVKEIINKYNKITNCSVVMVWIPSHVGIQGNEVADRLAKEALAHDSVDVELRSGARELSEAVDSHVRRLWQEAADKCETGHFNRALNVNVDEKIKYVNKSRGKEVVITRLRLGRCKLNYYLHRIGVHETGLCGQCGVPQTIEHFLMHCTHSPVKEIIKAACLINNVDFNVFQILASNTVVDAFYPYIDVPL